MDARLIRLARLSAYRNQPWCSAQRYPCISPGLFRCLCFFFQSPPGCCSPSCSFCPTSAHRLRQIPRPDFKFRSASSVLGLCAVFPLLPTFAQWFFFLRPETARELEGNNQLEKAPSVGSAQCGAPSDPGDITILPCGAVR